MNCPKSDKLDDLAILEDILNQLYKAFNAESSKVKVGDILKVIELKHKLSLTGGAERKFWAMIERVRKEELNAPSGAKSPAKKRRIAPKEAKAA